ncbi:HD-GYP domain-containing protein [Lentibacillus sediminis]|uniref:HD-GYP domain-containing protein n=1 Tax=Lentibacillus sediminis TaxID=1940529 RepID=UPI000C1BA0E5|nr:HD domain-containing phosphohydrolase [Lentibacillus sediminis]
MRVRAAQLVPGCILLKDVTGKTGRPLIARKTVLTEAHLDILKMFLVENVEVGQTLEDGSTFVPEDVPDKEPKRQEPAAETKLSFSEHFRLVAAGYEKLFQDWQNGVPMDIAAARKFILPLLEQLEGMEELHTCITRPSGFYQHNATVAVLAAATAKKLGWTKGEWLQIGLAGFLSDCGMSRLDPHMISSGVWLSDEADEEMKKHSTYSYRMLEKAPAITKKVKLAMLQHHERLDGSGYPLGVANEQIHPSARILAVCDAYSRQLINQANGHVASPYQALEAIHEGKFTRFDHQVVEALSKLIVNFSIGSKVKLSDQTTGQVVFMDEKHPVRPLVQLHGQDAIVPLKERSDLYISEVLLS